MPLRSGASYGSMGRVTVTPASSGTGARSRGRKTALDMVRSLGVLLAVVLPAVALWALLGSDEPTPVPEVDPAPSIRAAEASAPFTVLAVRQTPSDWKATSAVFTGPGEGEVSPSTLRVGYLTGSPGEPEFLGYRQTNEPRATAVEQVTGGSSAVAERTVAGAPWTVYETPRGEAAWVRTEPDSLLIVTGSAPESDFVELASLLS